MKISLNWLKKYVNITVSDEKLTRLIGARLVEVEGVIDERHKYDNIYVVRVESCEKIPDTHLTLCQIDCGVAELVQVVCGAPNVREGMLAVWIAPGAIVPASVHEDAPFVIGKRKMRGYESNGMLAGADELDFGDDHSGIVEIDPEMARPGDSLAGVFELNDLILEIENKSLTHRPDCFGLIGFAREVAGIMGQRFEEEPQVKVGGVFGPEDVVKLDVDAAVCQRYSALVLEKHGEMGKKYLSLVDTILSKSGMKPISPIVDATNYLMLLTGQPLHAFDYDKFVAVGGSDTVKVRVRLAKPGEKLLLLDDHEVVLNENDIVICSNDVPVALAGAMGGKSTEIDDSTKNIILESATFSLYNLRKTQMSHGIFSEAITRFTKGQPPYQTLAVAMKCLEMLSDGFRLAGVADEYSDPDENIVVKITTDEINGLLGTSYRRDLIVRTLENVGFRIKAGRGGLNVIVPAWRTDVHIKEDVIEEVGRLLGYDEIEPTLPLHATANRNELVEFKSRIRDTLVKYGSNEVLTYSFVSGRLMERAGQKEGDAYRIVNSISPDLQYVRQSIVPSLLEKAFVNQKLPVDKFAMFEMNEVYRKPWGVNEEKVPEGRTSLGFVLAERKNNETAFYRAKKYVASLLDELGIRAEYSEFRGKGGSEEAPFEPGRSAEIWIGDTYVGVVGEFKNSVRSEFKLAPYLAGFELVDLGLLLTNVDKSKSVDMRPVKVEDLTVTSEKSYADTLSEVREKYPGCVIRPLSIYQAPGQKTRNISFRIERK